MSYYRGSAGSWKVTVVNGAAHNTNWLFEKIKNTCSVSFHEINLHVEGRDLVFFVNNGAAAGALIDTSNCITTRYGSKIIIRAAAHYHGRRHDSVILNKDMSEQLKFCLGQRYKPTLMKLDLSSLLDDPILRDAGIDGNVANPNFMKKVLDIVHSVCPKLKILDLSKNDITQLESLTGLSEKCSELEELILSDNKIGLVSELGNISDNKKLKMLWLQGNPLGQQFTGGLNTFLADVSKFMPNLKILNGSELPPGMRVLQPEFETDVPSRKDVYAANRCDLELAKLFVQNFFQYYDYFDPSGRERLLDFYENNAVFSLCCNTSLRANVKLNLSKYMKKSRNLHGTDGKQNKLSFLLHKKVLIISFFTELPQTNHWYDSFTLDLLLATEDMLYFRVQGIFVEGEEETPWGFSRTFIGQRMPNSGISIVNEQLIIRNLTDKQVLLYEDAKYNNSFTPLNVTINIDDTEEPTEPIKPIEIS